MTNPQILVHRTDSSLDDELRSAVDTTGQIRPVFHFCSELRKTIAAARDYQPSIVILEISDDFETLRAVVDETIAAVPEATIVGVYKVDRLPQSMSESGTMMRALRLGMEDFLRRPVAGSDLSQVLARRITPRRKQRTATGKVVSFISNKGGVGKSTASVNVAVELAIRCPDRVALIDGSLQMGVCATQLDMQAETTLVDAWRQRERLDEQLLSQMMSVHESGLHLLAAPSSAIDAAEIDDAFLSRILLLARRTYDYVIVDTFPLFDRTIMAILDLSDHAIIVVENVVPTLQTVRGFFELLDEVDFPSSRQRVLLNRYSTRAGGPSTQEVSRYLGREADYVIPYDRSVVLAANTGRPFVMGARRWSKAIKAVRAIADDIQSESSTSIVAANNAMDQGYNSAKLGADASEVSEPLDNERGELQ